MHRRGRWRGRLLSGGRACAAAGPSTATPAVSIRVSSMLMWPCPAIFAANNVLVDRPRGGNAGHLRGGVVQQFSQLPLQCGERTLHHVRVCTVN
jgi:hypothetical protein